MASTAQQANPAAARPKGLKLLGREPLTMRELLRERLHGG